MMNERTTLDNGYTKLVEYSLGFNSAPLEWVTAHHDQLRYLLNTSGAVLLRGLPAEAGLFRSIVQVVGGTPLSYVDRSTPRTEVGNGLYTSTEYPADQEIPLHNENSYAASWPATLFFFCQLAAAKGGATPVADSRAVHALLPDDLRARFAGGVIYTRTYREEIGLSWQEAFQSADRETVDAYLASHGYTWEWCGDMLRTRHLRPATQSDPRSGAPAWFNQAVLFHVSGLDEEVREALLAEYERADLPRNAYLADGNEIDVADLDAIQLAYRTARIAEPWRAGDLLIVDNLLIAHGRQVFSGERRVLVAMT